MILNPAFLPIGQQFKRNIAFSHVASVMRGTDVVFSVGALWFSWTWLQGDKMIKGESSSSFAINRWVNRLIANVAPIAIALNNSLVIYLFSYCFQFVSFTAQVFLSSLFRISFTPFAISFSICVLGFQVVGRIIRFILAMLFLVVFSVFWCLSSDALFFIFTLFAMRIASCKSTFIGMKILDKLFNAAVSAKFVSKTWRDWFRLGIAPSLTALSQSAQSQA